MDNKYIDLNQYKSKKIEDNADLFVDYMMSNLVENNDEVTLCDVKTILGIAATFCHLSPSTQEEDIKKFLEASMDNFFSKIEM